MSKTLFPVARVPESRPDSKIGNPSTTHPAKWLCVAGLLWVPVTANATGPCRPGPRQPTYGEPRPFRSEFRPARRLREFL